MVQVGGHVREGEGRVTIHRDLQGWAARHALQHLVGCSSKLRWLVARCQRRQQTRCSAGPSCSTATRLASGAEHFPVSQALRDPAARHHALQPLRAPNNSPRAPSPFPACRCCARRQWRPGTPPPGCTWCQSAQCGSLAAPGVGAGSGRAVGDDALSGWLLGTGGSGE